MKTAVDTNVFVDILIKTQADRLLSHDRGFIKKYFPGLIVIP
jgi:predicted nucleic acid-binding protein